MKKVCLILTNASLGNSIQQRSIALLMLRFRLITSIESDNIELSSLRTEIKHPVSLVMSYFAEKLTDKV